MDTALAVLGAVGVGTIISALAYFRTLTRTQLLLRMRYRTPADVVLTTSLSQEGSEQAAYRRVLTSVGNLRASSHFSRAIGAIRARKEIRIRLSREVDSPLDHDLVVIGGAQRNEVARHFLRHLKTTYPDIGLEFDDVTPARCRTTLGDFCTEYDYVEQPNFPGVPQVDVGLVVLWINPFAVRRNRGILCSGFTSHGTAAAADYLLGDFAHEGLRRRRAQIGPPVWKLWQPRRLARRFVARPQFAMLIQITLLGDRPIDVKELAFVWLEDRDLPLRASREGLLSCSGPEPLGGSPPAAGGPAGS